MPPINQHLLVFSRALVRAIAIAAFGSCFFGFRSFYRIADAQLSRHLSSYAFASLRKGMTMDEVEAAAGRPSWISEMEGMNWVPLRERNTAGEVTKNFCKCDNTPGLTVWWYNQPAPGESYWEMRSVQFDASRRAIRIVPNISFD